MSRTTLQAIVEDSPAGPFMLRRIAQAAIMADRGISQGRLARELGLSKETISLYFHGRTAARPEPHPEFRTEGCNCDRISRHERFIRTVDKTNDRSEEREDQVERAIENLSKEDGFELPPVAVVVGEADATGIPDVTFPQNYISELASRDLMQVDAGMLRRPRGSR